MRTCFFPDNTVLVKLGYINRISLIEALIPERGWCEVIKDECAASSRRPGLSRLQDAPSVFPVTYKPTERERDLTFELRDQMRRPGDAATKHVGEAETIAIITTRSIKAIFATDDHGAAAAARTAGILVIDTWDLLRLAHKKDHITVAEAYADACHLDSLGEGWPPCERNLDAFTAWIS